MSIKRERDDGYQSRYPDPYKRPRTDQSTNQSIHQSIYQPTYPPTYQPGYKSINQSINPSTYPPYPPAYPPHYGTNQQTNQSTNQSMKTFRPPPPPSIKQPINQPISQYPPPPQPPSGYQSTYQSTYPSATPSTNQSTNQSVNQSADSLRLLIDGPVIDLVMRNLPLIEKMSGVHISVISPKQPITHPINQSINQSRDERILVIDGSDSVKSKAVSAMLDSFTQADPFHTGELSIKILCHKLRIGAVIGRGGESVKSTQSMSGAKISVTTDSLGQSSEKVITLAGSAQAINQAVLIVLEQLKAHPLRDQTPYTFYEPGTPHTTSLLPSEARRGFGLPPWQPYGYAAPVAPRTESFSARVAIPAVCSGCVLGKAGSIIKELRATTNTNISLADPTTDAPNERVVTISGTPGNIHQAIELIREAVERYRE